MKYIGCQTITWGDMHQENIEKVFREVKKAGYVANLNIVEC